MGPPLRGFWLPDVRPRIQHCRRARPELRSVMPDVRCCASGCARKSKVCREVVRCAVPEVPGDQTGRFSTCATRARITRTINPELRDRAPERLTTRHAQPRNSRDAFQELRACAPDGAARPWAHPRVPVGALRGSGVVPRNLRRAQRARHGVTDRMTGTEPGRPGSVAA